VSTRWNRLFTGRGARVCVGARVLCRFLAFAPASATLVQSSRSAFNKHTARPGDVHRLWSTIGEIDIIFHGLTLRASERSHYQYNLRVSAPARTSDKISKFARSSLRAHLSQRPKPFAMQRDLVNKYLLRPIVWDDESKPFAYIEPFHLFARALASISHSSTHRARKTPRALVSARAVDHRRRDARIATRRVSSRVIILPHSSVRRERLTVSRRPHRYARDFDARCDAIAPRAPSFPSRARVRSRTNARRDAHVKKKQNKIERHVPFPKPSRRSARASSTNASKRARVDVDE